MNQTDIFGETTSINEVTKLNNAAFTEAWALIEAAQRIAAPIQSSTLDDPDPSARGIDLESLLKAVRLNSDLWGIFRTEIESERGVIPANIRSDMLTLCQQVEAHSIDTINEPTIERAFALIEINRQVAHCLLESLQTGMDVAEAKADAIPPAEIEKKGTFGR